MSSRLSGLQAELAIAEARIIELKESVQAAQAQIAALPQAASHNADLPIFRLPNEVLIRILRIYAQDHYHTSSNGAKRPWDSAISVVSRRFRNLTQNTPSFHAFIDARWTGHRIANVQAMLEKSKSAMLFLSLSSAKSRDIASLLFSQEVMIRVQHLSFDVTERRIPTLRSFSHLPSASIPALLSLRLNFSGYELTHLNVAPLVTSLFTHLPTLRSLSVHGYLGPLGDHVRDLTDFEYTGVVDSGALRGQVLACLQRCPSLHTFRLGFKRIMPLPTGIVESDHSSDEEGPVSLHPVLHPVLPPINKLDQPADLVQLRNLTIEGPFDAASNVLSNITIPISLRLSCHLGLPLHEVTGLKVLDTIATQSAPSLLYWLSAVPAVYVSLYGTGMLRSIFPRTTQQPFGGRTILLSSVCGSTVAEATLLPLRCNFFLHLSSTRQSII